MSRAVLAPGLRVLQRSHDELQIGLGREVRLRVPATEPVRRTLDRLQRGEAVPSDPATRAVLDLLAPVLVDGAGLVVDGIAAGDVAATALSAPGDYRERLAARRRATVAVRGDLGVPGADPGRLLDAAGVHVVPVPQPETVVLVLATGEVDRDELDPLVRAGTPHLLVRVVEGTAVVGPFVHPGRTACLRCLDAHAQVGDPEAPLLTARHARAATDRHDGVAEPVDNALASLAVSWAVRDLLTYLDGGRPATWSAVITLPLRLAAATQTEWLRHPGCGCAWLPDALTDTQPSRTMGA
jgi:bacteriocin biosynthesis cyclodehydratase domain-containing protein